MRRRLKALAWLFVFLGLLAGPGYWAYCKFFTGSDAALVTMTLDPPGDDPQRTWRSNPFKLTRDMAPAGLVLLARGHLPKEAAGDGPLINAYSATLNRDGNEAAPLAFALGVKRVSDSSPSFRQHLLFMRKVQSGEYSLTITETAPPAVEIKEMQLQVRQHLQEPLPIVMMAGAGLLALGLMVLPLL